MKIDDNSYPLNIVYNKRGWDVEEVFGWCLILLPLSSCEYDPSPFTLATLSHSLLQLYSAPAIMGTLTYIHQWIVPFLFSHSIVRREDLFAHLHYSVPGETRLFNVSQREKENWSRTHTLHCFTSIWPPTTRCFPFSRSYHLCHNNNR